MKLALFLCVYSAAMYSFMRACMTETKTPAMPASWSFVLSLFWFPIIVIGIASDVFQGVRELLEKK